MIKITPEYWGEPGSITYHYVHKQDHTLWNVSSVRNHTVGLWSINAWGHMHHAKVGISDFEIEYKSFTEPSMYQQMDKATK